MTLRLQTTYKIMTDNLTAEPVCLGQIRVGALFLEYRFIGDLRFYASCFYDIMMCPVPWTERRTMANENEFFHTCYHNSLRRDRSLKTVVVGGLAAIYDLASDEEPIFKSVPSDQAECNWCGECLTSEGRLTKKAQK
jgi:hypothetical protein